MDCSPAWLAETLAADFPDQSVVAVMDVVTECVALYPDDDALFVEQVARARLVAARAAAASSVRHGASPDGIPRQRPGS